jgi:hypothetical protein
MKRKVSTNEKSMEENTIASFFEKAFFMTTETWTHGFMNTNGVRLHL